eukprot:CAMPEP_0169471336 /NCGR_PEP_ID=MMETSP1042-20121227/24542_1 /TAXON_ID=464988 /ORGANISM="Hemiselmis andersenii, Strain CCMP1180" /LENGTH=91 /DNA_ID=CAMNT_0009585039 /DNA_START=26 /DNA_END=301 /DNA_ORIENTATION=+
MRQSDCFAIPLHSLFPSSAPLGGCFRRSSTTLAFATAISPPSPPLEATSAPDREHEITSTSPTNSRSRLILRSTAAHPSASPHPLACPVSD